jgi:hypothetical protein
MAPRGLLFAILFSARPKSGGEPPHSKWGLGDGAAESPRRSGPSASLPSGLPSKLRVNRASRVNGMTPKAEADPSAPFPEKPRDRLRDDS